MILSNVHSGRCRLDLTLQRLDSYSQFRSQSFDSVRTRKRERGAQTRLEGTCRRCFVRAFSFANNKRGRVAEDRLEPVRHTQNQHRSLRTRQRIRRGSL